MFEFWIFMCVCVCVRERERERSMADDVEVGFRTQPPLV